MSDARAESLPGMRRLGCPMWSVALAPSASAADEHEDPRGTSVQPRSGGSMKRAIALTAPPGCGA